MGRQKDEMERGWMHIDAYICPDCFDDSYLKELVESNAEANTCSYCPAEESKPIAAAADLIIERIYTSILRRFDDPSSAGVPYEKGYLIESMDTMEVLYSLPLECTEGFLDDVVKSIVNTAWVDAPGGHWLGVEKSSSLFYSWEHFSTLVRHQIRYFFLAQKTDDDGIVDPENMGPSATLDAIAQLVQGHRLISLVDEGTTLYRVRAYPADNAWPLDEKTLGAPPEDLAAAGRMNPAGIPYLYLSFEEGTAIAEASPNATAAVGRFSVQQPLKVLNLASLPKIPSVFEDESYEERQEILFLKRFTDSIQEPIRKDGREHIEYVPTQIVSEYFSCIFKADGEEMLDGILYPSSVNENGTNLVLFPGSRFQPDGERRVSLVESYIKK